MSRDALRCDIMSCTAQQASPSNLTKCCPCHEKWCASYVTHHPPTSPNTAPATQKYTPKSKKNLPKTATNTGTLRTWTAHDSNMNSPSRTCPFGELYFSLFLMLFLLVFGWSLLCLLTDSCWWIPFIVIVDRLPIQTNTRRKFPQFVGCITISLYTSLFPNLLLELCIYLFAFFLSPIQQLLSRTIAQHNRTDFTLRSLV